MVFSLPMILKNSASFSQSIRNRLRLKNLQAQAKNFCRVLDIRVAQVVDADALYSALFCASVHFIVQVVLGKVK